MKSEKLDVMLILWIKKQKGKDKRKMQKYKYLSQKINKLFPNNKGNIQNKNKKKSKIYKQNKKRQFFIFIQKQSRVNTGCVKYDYYNYMLSKKQQKKCLW